MALFQVPVRPNKSNDLTIAKKSKTRSKITTTIKSGSSLIGQINQIKAMVERKLGQFKDDYIIIQTQQDLHNYIEKCICNGVISIDTETTGLDPLQDDIVGICVYTPNEKAAYIPINHISYVTGIKAGNQLEKDVVKQEFKILTAHKDNVDIIMFNAKFDIRVMRNCLGISDIYCTWDAYLAARLLNENEEYNGLKPLHEKYVLNGEGDAFGYSSFFKNIPFNVVPINCAYLYAAHDAIITYELYKYQEQFLYYDEAEPNSARNGMNGVSWVFFNIEMPCINVVCDMEDNGIEFDMKYCSELSVKYNKLLEEKTKKFYSLCDMYKSEIDDYIVKHPDCKLEVPINIASPTQIAVLLYDVLHVESVDTKKPRGTGEDILKKIADVEEDGIAEICNAILEYREMAKLISTYIDKLPDCVNPKDGRIHCSFNQYGADTGRFSSSDPNLQNIPSKNHDVRKMFKASSKEHIIEFDTEDDYIDLIAWNDIETVDGWKRISNLQITDKLCTNDGVIDIRKLEKLNEKTLRIYL